MNKLFSVLLLAAGICFPGSIYAAGNVITESASVSQQQRTVSGTVEDALGPVTGATVLIKGTTIGTVTDMDGRFSLEVSDGQTLVVSFIGFTPQEIVINGQSTVNVSLREDSQRLDEVVVTALGIRKEAKKLGYAISTLSSSDLVKVAAPTLGSALYGKASGVRVQTAPGGAMGSISINVRGLTSMTGTNQPLVVMDGVPIRNGEANLGGYWDSQRISSNGLADVNPEDIETLSILKGASASALYGSEAANGVVLITTKSGRGATGVGVDFNASFTVDPVAYMPEYQTSYGPGTVSMSRTASTGLNHHGWLIDGWNDRHGVNHRRGSVTTMYWGPKYDGEDVLYWDGTARKYSVINENPWSEIFRTGFNQQYNLSITKGSEAGNLRFSYTFADNKPTQYNSTFSKHNFNLAGTHNITKNLKMDYNVTYMLQDIKNRPYRISRLTNNFTGMFGPFDDIAYLRDHTVTSLGYMNQVYTATDHLTPDEGFEWTPSINAVKDEYLWHILGKERLENRNRLWAHVSPSWEIIEGLTLTGRAATDYTTEKTENKENVAQAIMFNPNQGYYELRNNRYEIYYGDLLLSYNTQLNDTWGVSATAGWNGRLERQYDTWVGTSQGLSVENWFHLNASNGPKNANMTTTELLRTAFFGTASVSYGNWGFLEGTVRQEKISTLSPGMNSFFYPSVNGSVIFSDLLGDKMPEWYNYGKVRASYGVVGTTPDIYKANKAYTQETVGGQWIYNTPSIAPVGNDNIQPEQKYEWEFGLESKFFNNRLGFEASYYTNVVKDQILEATMSESSGGQRILLNIGELENSGFEFSAYGTPIETRDFRWDLRGNISFLKNKVVKLMDGIDRITHTNLDNGSAYLYSFAGRPMGDLYAYTPLKDENGNNIVKENGYYQLTSEPVRVGNVIPKATGGLGSTFVYKNFVLDALFDFRIGGAIMNTPYQYMMGQGAIKESLKYHDGEGYGQTYYLTETSTGMVITPHNGTQGPNGERIFDNGIILPGVKADGTPNNTMIAADQWAYWTYNWGGYDPTGETYYSHGIFDNTFVKCRELSLGYNIPQSLLSKIKCKSLMVSVFGRNLFYVYKNLPIFDAEAADATDWKAQAFIGGSSATTRSIGVSLRASF